MSIRPNDFESDHPPVRTIGTECEYNHQSDADGSSNYAFLDNDTLRANGINIQNSYLGEEYGAGKTYPDVEHLEFDTRESMGPASAAVEDLAGIAHLSRIAEATQLPHNGIYRLSGTYIQDGLVSNANGRTSSGRSSGYHESYLFSRSLEHSIPFVQLMPSALAYQVWGRGGTLRPEGFVFSQKIWGNGGNPIEHSLARRTSHGQKPMITVPNASSDADTLGVQEWARAEIRMPDPGLSLVNRYLSFANVSLALRLVEQHRRLDLNQQRLASLCLVDPVEAAKDYAGDLSLKKTHATIDNRSITALDGQESLLELFEQLAVEVALPADEKLAISGIRSVVDALRSSNPKNAEYSGIAQLRVEFAPKHLFVSKNKAQVDVNAHSQVAMHRNIEWSRILPVGPGQRYWQRVEQEQRDPLALAIRNLAADAGVSQRSAIRASIIDNPSIPETVVDWSHYKDSHVKPQLLGSPAGD